MNKFLESLQRMNLHPKRIALPGSFTEIVTTQQHDSKHYSAVLYRIEATIGATVMIQDGPDFERAREYQAQHMRAAIAAEVYGEIKQKLRSLYPHLLEVKAGATRDLRTFEAVGELERGISEAIDMMTPR